MIIDCRSSCFCSVECCACVSTVKLVCSCDTCSSLFLNSLKQRNLRLVIDNYLNSLALKHGIVARMNTSCQRNANALIQFREEKLRLALLCSISDEEDDLQDDLSSLTEKANVDSLRLSKFLQRATQVCSTILLPP